jgi:hypothetical protein
MKSKSAGFNIIDPGKILERKEEEVGSSFYLYS